jgi:signal transduction histidine kinase
VRTRIWGRASVLSSFHASLVSLALVASILIFVIVAEWTYTPFWQDWFVFGLFLGCLAYMGAGVLLWWYRPTNRLGLVMVGVAILWLLTGIDTLPNQAAVKVGFIFASTPIAGLFHILMAFPSGRLRSRVARWLVGLMWFSRLVLWAPQYLLDPSRPDSVIDRPDIAHAVHQVQLYVFTIPISLAAAAVLVARIRRTAPRLRWVLWPLYGYGLAAIFALPITYDILGPRLGLDRNTVTGIQLFTIGIAPVFFAAAALSGAFGRTGQVDELAAWLSTTRGSEHEVEHMLARTLGDDSVQLLFWLDGPGRYVDSFGVVVALPDDQPARRVVDIEVDGRKVGALIYDGELIPEPAPAQSAARVVALAVDRERLLAELRSSDEALRQSRQRLVETGDRERRRISRNLHDGIQGRLVMLAVDAGTLADAPGVPETARTAADTLRTRIDAAAAELRQVVYEIMPAPLIERDLVTATEDLVDRTPMPTTLSVGRHSHDLPSSVQSTAYFIVAEALTNAVKYAHASAAQVSLDYDGKRLIVQVTDDGIGGASSLDGFGLRGLTDRAEALGGSLTLKSAPGLGTRLTAILPESPPAWDAGWNEQT